MYTIDSLYQRSTRTSQKVIGSIQSHQLNGTDCRNSEMFPFACTVTVYTLARAQPQTFYMHQHYWNRRKKCSITGIWGVLIHSHQRNEYLVYCITDPFAVINSLTIGGYAIPKTDRLNWNWTRSPRSCTHCINNVNRTKIHKWTKWMFIRYEKLTCFLEKFGLNSVDKARWELIS